MPRILISGICGFVGAAIARYLSEQSSSSDTTILGFDNLSRAGSWVNLPALREVGIEVVHADVRSPTDMEQFEACEFIIDAAANASVLAGISGGGASRALVETNLIGTVNLLELCRKWQAGLILLSTSRVYSLEPLCGLPLREVDHAYCLDDSADLPKGITAQGVTEEFATSSPISLYGATKLASEQMALEYGSAFDFPVWVNRCGVLSGAGQFAKPDQGIFTYWLHSWQADQPLRYIGFGGTGSQVRDCVHPRDLALLVEQQIRQRSIAGRPQIVNVSGGVDSARSLRQLSLWCKQRWGPRDVASVPECRPFDVPWMVLDNRLAKKTWNWQPTISMDSILDEIADFADQNPDWLSVSMGGTPTKCK